MTRRTEVFDLQSQASRTDGQAERRQLHVGNAEEAAAAVEPGISILSCEPDHYLADIRAAAPMAFVLAGMSHGAVASPEEAVRLGFQRLRRGADAAYCWHWPFFLEAMTHKGIPVTGHVGLVPNRATWTNVSAVGRTPEEAMRVLRAVRDLEDAGTACVKVEVVPVRLAEQITRPTPMITRDTGYGSACDTPYLFSSDVLGTRSGHYPRHSKRYDDVVVLMAEVPARRLTACKAFAAGAAGGAYPESRHQVDIDEATYDRFLSRAQSL